RRMEPRSRAQVELVAGRRVLPLLRYCCNVQAVFAPGVMVCVAVWATSRKSSYAPDKVTQRLPRNCCPWFMRSCTSWPTLPRDFGLWDEHLSNAEHMADSFEREKELGKQQEKRQCQIRNPQSEIRWPRVGQQTVLRVRSSPGL